MRLDLCNRHKDRHTAKGSALNRRDTGGSQAQGMDVNNRMGAYPAGSTSPEANRPGTSYGKGHPAHLPYHHPQSDPNGAPYTPMTSTPTGYANGGPPNGVDGYMHHDAYSGTPNQRSMHQSPTGHQRPPNAYGVISPVSTQPGYHTQDNTPQGGPFVPQSNFTPMTLPPQQYPATSTGREQDQTYASQSNEYSDHNGNQQQGEMLLLDQMSMPNTIPMFGGGSVLDKSPYVSLPDDFVSYLFNSGQQGGEGSPMATVVPPGYEPYQGYNVTNFGGDPSQQMGYIPPSAPTVMAVTSILDSNLPESVLSEDKSNEIFEFISNRFHENDTAPVNRQRENILEGDRTDERHILSRKMMQHYIGSYWLHFSDQVPILHKPTFVPDKTPNLLLIAMMTIGAACLDKAQGHPVTEQLSNFLAWHLRWEIFMDVNFRPPAKLWVFQTLLLLELYEKMYATRELHERAHIHHATTITLMRRGRALIGRSAMDSPPNPRDDRHPSGHGSRHASAGLANTQDDWWNHWITNEATRRAAFAAFVIDSIHATMFGHSTVMVAHEMRLPLPCDDALWKATSGSEVGRMESNIIAQGLKPISFLEGLKRTLSGQEVSTNSFGRTILMAGLLSVSWHMNQRDLQVNSLGGGGVGLGGRDKWRATLTRAFDSWKTDFDKSLSRESAATGHVNDPYSYDQDKANDANVVFESRTVLHHLAHMATHVDIVDCQITARAKRLLGRAIGANDLTSAQRRMKDIWAPSARARDATFYALRFLCSVLLPEEAGAGNSPGSQHNTNSSNGTSTTASSATLGGQRHGHHQHSAPASPAGQLTPVYSARDDVLVNRPWVLYFATLVVWCYGYSLEGPCPDVPPPSSPTEALAQMYDYLRRYGSVSSPEELKSLRGINANSALLMVLRDEFKQTRWELLHEGSQLLNNCINLNAGGQ